MNLSMTLPTMLPHTRADFLSWCRGVDASPVWTSLAVPERITYTSHDLTVQLAGAAAVTERVRLWSTIVILPAHDAVAVAKQMASIDVMSAGRLTVGVGIGGREHDYRAVDAPFARRFPRMDEQVATMRRIWSGEPPFEGADPVGPPPVQPGGPPLIAGVFGPKGIARAARWAAG
ncbi:MAG TPA: LLM class flavin-dependent oxidoreductase, partial [Acidimicrobiia bacterium]|nr:LLM class flavin-dependent oxidoreductase [Acidimicrobiia bacterium]